MDSIKYNKPLWLWTTRIFSIISMVVAVLWLLWRAYVFVVSIVVLLEMGAAASVFLYLLMESGIVLFIIALAIGTSLLGIMGSFQSKLMFIRLYYMLIFVLTVLFIGYHGYQVFAIIASGVFTQSTVIAVLMDLILLILVPLGCWACAFCGIMLDFNIKNQRATMTYNNAADVTVTYATTFDQPNGFSNL